MTTATQTRGAQAKGVETRAAILERAVDLASAEGLEGLTICRTPLVSMSVGVEKLNRSLAWLFRGVFHTSLPVFLSRARITCSSTLSMENTSRSSTMMGDPPLPCVGV